MPTPASTLEALRSAVPCQRVLEVRGIPLTVSGSGFMACCPLPGHDDRSPSFRIDEAAGKSLFHCFGCGRSGDVFDLVKLLDACDFRQAVATLAQIAGISLENSNSAGKGRTSPLPALPLDPGASGSELDRQMVSFAHACLMRPDSPGRVYLERRRVWSDELAGVGRLGFFPQKELGRLLEAHRLDRMRVAGAALRRALTEGGWYNQSTGHPTLDGRVVVPLFAGDGTTVVQCYGRAVTEGLKSQALHRHLARPVSGVWNRAGWVVEGAAILCEAAIDAFSLWVAGLRNVSFSLGVGNVTEEHVEVLRAGGAREVWLAFDHDEAGQRAAVSVGERLIAQGFTVFRALVPPAVKDVNGLAMQAGDDAPAALRDLIRSAAWMGGTRQVGIPSLPEGVEQTLDPEPVQTTETVENPVAPFFRAEGFDLHATLGNRAYRVRGFDGRTITDSLKITLRLGVAWPVGERVHVDTLDLYHARARQVFAVAAAEETGLDPAVIKADLGRLLGELELRQKVEKPVESAPDPVASMSAGERAAALELLGSPDLVARVLADLTACGLVGEEDNKLVAYLAGTSRLLAQPLAIVVQSSSAAGKSALLDAVLGFMPAEAVSRYAAMSSKSPYYAGDLRHRILAIAEEEGSRRASYPLKLLQSDGSLTCAVPWKDPETGRMAMMDYTVEGPIALMQTTTAIDVDPELANRCLVLTVDEDPDQTAAIQAAQRRARTREGMEARARRAAVQHLHQNAQRLLKPLVVVNGFAERLTFAAGSTRLRRDHVKYLTLIEAVAILHQHQREVRQWTQTDGTTVDYIEVQPSDIQLANRLAAKVLGQSLDDLPPHTRKFLVSLRAWVEQQAAAKGMSVERLRFTRRMLCEGLSLGLTQVRQHLVRLVEHELVDPLRVVGEGILQEYRLAWNGRGLDGSRFELGRSGYDCHLSDLSVPCRGGVGQSSEGLSETECLEKSNESTRKGSTCRPSGDRAQGGVGNCLNVVVDPSHAQGA